MIVFMHHGHTSFNVKLLSSRAQLTLLLLYSDIVIQMKATRKMK